MSENEALEAGELQAVRDLKLGIRARRNWAKVVAVGEKCGLTNEQVRGFVTQGGFIKSDADRKALADGLNIDWEGLTEFMEALAPIIIEMMAACA